MMMNRSRIITKSSLAVQQRTRDIGSGARPAKGWTTLRTGEAVATARHEDHYDMIADLKIGFTLA
jgi:hypothetical protein